MSLSRVSRNSRDALPNGRYLIIHSTMQGLCLDNDKRKETMNSYFSNTANSDIIQSPVAFESTEKAFNRASPILL